MSSSLSAKITGRFLITALWILSGAVGAALLALLFLHVEGQYFVTPERTEDVSILKLASSSSDVRGSNLAVEYVVKFRSGEEVDLSFPGDAHMLPGDHVRLWYVRTTIRNKVLLTRFEKLNRAQ